MSYTDLIDALQASARRFTASFGDLAEAQFRFKPSGGGWSIAETAEHVVLSEVGSGKMLGRMVKEASPAEAVAAAVGGEERVAQLLAHGQNRREAPDFVRPTGRWGTLQEIVQAFEESRNRTIAFISTTPLDLAAFVAPHPALGSLTATQWAWFLVHHGDHHVAQIAEIKADPGYPAA